MQRNDERPAFGPAVARPAVKATAASAALSAWASAKRDSLVAIAYGVERVNVEGCSHGVAWCRVSPRAAVRLGLLSPLPFGMAARFAVCLALGAPAGGRFTADQTACTSGSSRCFLLYAQFVGANGSTAGGKAND